MQRYTESAIRNGSLLLTKAIFFYLISFFFLWTNYIGKLWDKLTCISVCMCVCLISYWVWEKKNNINWIYNIIMYMVNTFHTCLLCFCDCHTTCLPEKLVSDLWFCHWSAFKLFQFSYEFFIEFDFLLPLYLSVIRLIFLKRKDKQNFN